MSDPSPDPTAAPPAPAATASGPAGGSAWTGSTRLRLGWCAWGSIGAVWGLAEAAVAGAKHATDPLTILAFYPLVLLPVWLVLSLVNGLGRDALRGTARIAAGLAWVAFTVPLAVSANLAFVRNVPFLSGTNAALVGGAAVAALAPAWVAFRIALWLAPPAARATTGGRTAQWALPLALAVICALRCTQTFFPGAPGPWPDNRGKLEGRPNVVLITLDTLRSDHVSALGYERATTPNLEALPAVRFDNAYSTGHWTAPSTASLLTGLQPATHQTNWVGSVLPTQAATLTELLSAAGYVTGYFTGNFVVSPVFGFARGADYVVSEERLPQHRLVPSSLGHVIARKIGNVTRAEHLNRWALPFLESVARRPFFLYLHYKDPHQPYVPPAPHDDLFDPGFTGRRIVDPSVSRYWPISDRERHNMVARYDGEIRYLDEQLGVLFDALEQHGLADDTLVIVTSDHGEEFAEHERWLHGKTLYDEVTRVPLLVAPPRRSATPRGPSPPADLTGVDALRGTTLDTPVSLVDVAPTVLDLVGLPIPESMQGQSLVPLLRGEPNPEPRPILLDGSKTQRVAIVDGRYKLIRRDNPDGVAWILFDLQSDPGETLNLAGRQRDVFRRMRDQLESRLEQLRQVSLPAEQKVLDAVEEERLRQMGYLR